MFFITLKFSLFIWYLHIITEDTETLADAYEELANFEIKSDSVFSSNITSKISRIRNLTTTALPSSYLSVDPSGHYQNLLSIHKFEGTFKLVGGIHLPKLITCIASDGRAYRQLVKSKDDLRQDAVMQQIFLLVNALLREHHETRVRNLCIRTYHVVPLTPCSGLVEWVEKTVSLKAYLVGDKANCYHCAHYRYRPQDKLSHECREELGNAKGEKDKCVIYEKITQNFKPVFHHYFLEHFAEPATWFAKRLSYTRSTACNSMIGYVVGLGDRHVDNILIDQHSCEVLHIDLGIAFEQGKTLRVSEIVPFRLTRDVVDGMGVTGVEGTYRSCCEETMKVLRANKEYVLTIAEVFLHDPLFRWSISPALALHAQRNEDEEVVDFAMLSQEGVAGGESNVDEHHNKDAARTLLRLQAKLQGSEYGEMLSVEGQVMQLINEARDPMRLALMYAGWSPWI
jgi:serine-protein kinase ATM